MQSKTEISDTQLYVWLMTVLCRPWLSTEFSESSFTYVTSSIWNVLSVCGETFPNYLYFQTHSHTAILHPPVLPPSDCQHNWFSRADDTRDISVEVLVPAAP